VKNAEGVRIKNGLVRAVPPADPTGVTTFRKGKVPLFPFVGPRSPNLSPGTRTGKPRVGDPGGSDPRANRAPLGPFPGTLTGGEPGLGVFLRG